MPNWVNHATDHTHDKLVDYNTIVTPSTMGGGGPHTHTEYAATVHAHAHDHDGTYSAAGHNHVHAHDASYEAIGAVAAHAGLADPHVAYALDADLANHETAGHVHNHDGAYAPTHAHPYAASGHNHDASYSASGHTHSYEAAGAVATHAGLTDPHPTYLTAAEGNAAYSASGHTHPGGSQVYAVGDLYLTTRVGDPATLLGYGTWARWGVGRFLLGTDTTAEVTGGSATHTHADHTGVINHTHPVTDPGHSHLTQRYPTATGGSSGFTIDTSMSGTLADNTLPTKAATTGVTTANPAAGVAALSHDAPSHLPPSITAFLWKRTA